MDAAEYKHVVLGLIFLKYISDAFEAKHAELELQRSEGADPEDSDEYRAAGIFWVPPEARWSHLQANAPQPTIGMLVDDAMTAIECDNPTLKSVLPKDYARPGLTPERLGQVINLVSDIGLGSAADRARDTLGRVYEYFLQRFASAEGKSGGQFYTPARGAGPGGDASALQRPRLRPLLRIGRHVRAKREVHPGARGTYWGHLHLRPRVQLHHLAAGEDEPGHPRHRSPDCPRRLFPQRSASRLEGRLCPRQPTLQRQRLARRPAPGRPALGLRRPAGGQRQLRWCSTSSTIWPPPA